MKERDPKTSWQDIIQAAKRSSEFLGIEVPLPEPSIEKALNAKDRLDKIGLSGMLMTPLICNWHITPGGQALILRDASCCSWACRVTTAVSPCELRRLVRTGG